VHRHTQNAFRFVVEGEGVWTVVDDDPVAMRRGDFLLTPGWRSTAHHNRSDTPMAWLDGLDIPFVHATGSAFFELGPDRVADHSTPARSRAERLWAHPGCARCRRRTGGRAHRIAAYRWEHTDAALADQLTPWRTRATRPQARSWTTALAAIRFKRNDHSVLRSKSLAYHHVEPSSMHTGLISPSSTASYAYLDVLGPE
jgi:gentisate 1,2-dioxygenase